MMPSRPMRGRARPLPGASASALAVDVLVAVMERVDLLLGQWDRLPERAREVDGAGDVLAHDRRLDRVARGGADREHAVAAHEHRRRAMAGERLHHRAADLLVADEGERRERDL